MMIHVNSIYKYNFINPNNVCGFFFYNVQNILSSSENERRDGFLWYFMVEIKKTTTQYRFKDNNNTYASSAHRGRCIYFKYYNIILLVYRGCGL